MSERKKIGQKLRFEVFKRDKFSCQYCGAKAPDVLLHVDHLHPVAKGGENDVLNLVTSCEECNSGKGACLLDDASVVERQRAQIEALEERREQLQMMLQWRDELERVKTDTVEIIASRIGERGGDLTPNENGRADIRKWLKRFEFDEILYAVDESFDSYMKWNGDEPDVKAWNVAFTKIPAICSIQRQMVQKPYLPNLFYIQGILRKRFRDKRGQYVHALETMMIEWGATTRHLEDFAKIASDWEDFSELAFAAGQEERSKEGAA